MVDQESVRPLAESAAAKAKHTPAPGYDIVARAITGDDPPAWLVKFLKMWGPCLAVDRGVAAVKLPTRAQMRKTCYTNKLLSLHNFLFAIPQAAARPRSGYVLICSQDNHGQGMTETRVI